MISKIIDKRIIKIKERINNDKIKYNQIIKRIRNDKDIFQKYWHNKIKIIVSNDKK